MSAELSHCLWQDTRLEVPVRRNRTPDPEMDATEKSRLIQKDSDGLKIMGLTPSPELLAISMVYFVQGL